MFTYISAICLLNTRCYLSTHYIVNKMIFGVQMIQVAFKNWWHGLHLCLDTTTSLSGIMPCPLLCCIADNIVLFVNMTSRVLSNAYTSFCIFQYKCDEMSSSVFSMYSFQVIYEGPSFFLKKTFCFSQCHYAHPISLRPIFWILLR